MRLVHDLCRIKCSASLSWFLSAHEIHSSKIHSPFCQEVYGASPWLLPSECPSRFWPHSLSEVSFLLSLLTHQLAQQKGPASSCVPCASCGPHAWPQAPISGQAPCFIQPSLYPAPYQEKTCPLCSHNLAWLPIRPNASLKSRLFLLFITRTSHLKRVWLSSVQFLDPASDMGSQVVTDQIGAYVLEYDTCL